MVNGRVLVSYRIFYSWCRVFLADACGHGIKTSFCLYGGGQGLFLCIPWNVLESILGIVHTARMIMVWLVHCTYVSVDCMICLVHRTYVLTDEGGQW
jgi:hypothetical protein